MSQNKIKITFIIPSLKAGGAERVMSFIAKSLNPSRFETSMIIIGFKKDCVFDIENVNVHFLNKKKVSQSFFKVNKTLKTLQPDIVVGSISHINIMLSLISVFFKKTKFVGRESNVASVRKKQGEKENLFLNFLHKRSLTVLDAIICQSNDMYEDFKNYYTINSKKFIIINNPITDNFILKKSNTDNRIIKYITIGSLHKRKGHIRILEILSKLDHKFHYTIIGNGNEYDHIISTIENLNLTKVITHIPYSNKVSTFLAENDVFLNGSYVEGFPNVMIESCAVGTPVIAFEAPGGINEILINGVNGYIVNTQEAYINQLNKIAKQNPFIPSLVSESVTSRYSKEVIINKYETFFEDLFNNKL